MNNLDPDVAASPDQLAVYGGIGKAARNQDCYRAFSPELEILGNDQTLPIQPSKPMAVFFCIQRYSPSLDCQIKPGGSWTNWDEFHRSDRLDLMPREPLRKTDNSILEE
jgi:urocanate hydratase